MVANILQLEARVKDDRNTGTAKEQIAITFTDWVFSIPFSVALQRADERMLLRHAMYYIFLLGNAEWVFQ